MKKLSATSPASDDSTMQYDITSEHRTIWLWKSSPRRHLHPMTQPCKDDITSERRTIWLWKCFPRRHLHPMTQPRNTTSPQNIGPCDYEKALRDVTCIRWLNHAKTTSPRNEILRDVTCIRWLNHAHTTSPQNEGRYEYETTLRDVTCIRWLNHAIRHHLRT